MFGKKRANEILTGRDFSFEVHFYRAASNADAV